MTRPLTLTCPIDPCGATLTATLEPLAKTPYVLDLTGCEHADGYAEGIVNTDVAELIDWAIARANGGQGSSQPQYDTWEEKRGER